MESIQELHRAEYEDSPGAVVTVPGVVTLMGEYSDFCDGYTLTGAIPQILELAISKRSDNSLRFYSVDLNERKRTTTPNLKFRREDRWANYIKGVLYEMLRRNYAFKGLNITVRGTIPQKVGLKSSTALCAATALGLKQLYHYEVDDTQLIQAVYFAETSFMQTKARLVDIMTMLYAKAGSFLLFDMHTLEYSHVPWNPKEGLLLITESDIPQFSIRDELIYREEACQAGFEVIKEKNSGGVIRDIALQEVLSASEQMPEEKKKICYYVLEESWITKDAVTAIHQHDNVAFGKSMNRLQSGLRDLFEVSCPEVDWLTKRAIETSGCYGSKMIGPGFGGCTLTLIQESAIEAYTEKLEEYEHIFGYHPAWFRYYPAGSAEIVS